MDKINIQNKSETWVPNLHMTILHIFLFVINDISAKLKKHAYTHPHIHTHTRTHTHP